MPSEIFPLALGSRTAAKYRMGLKFYKIISRPPKVFRQYGFVKTPDHDFLPKTLILGILFFGTHGRNRFLQAGAELSQAQVKL